jgi:hypothetical protein
MDQVKTQRMVSRRNKLSWKVRELMRAFQAKQITLAALGEAEVVDWPQRALGRPTG